MDVIDNLNLRNLLEMPTLNTGSSSASVCVCCGEQDSMVNSSVRTLVRADHHVPREDARWDWLAADEWNVGASASSQADQSPCPQCGSLTTSEDGDYGFRNCSGCEKPFIW